MTTKNWMAELAAHYEKTRQLYPQDKLMLVFDIDGTIIDMRCLIRHLLQTFDRTHRTHLFDSLKISDIAVHENHIEPLLTRLQIGPEQQAEILAWYLEQRWSSSAILESHHPFRGGWK